MVNGTLTSGGGIVSVAGNATLGGAGTIHRAVTLLDDAILAPGDNGLRFGPLPTDALYALDTSTAGQVNLSVVPEPATAALLLGGGLAMTLRRRQRRKPDR